MDQVSARPRPPFILTASPGSQANQLPLACSIEGNCVLIGACIPTMLPLIRKIFGQSVLGGSTPPKDSNLKDSNLKDSGPNNALITIGSFPKGKKRAKSAFGLSQLDTVDDSKYIILEERSFHASTTELQAEDVAAARLEQVRQQKQITQPGW